MSQKLFRCIHGSVRGIKRELIGARNNLIHIGANAKYSFVSGVAKESQ